MKQKQLQLQPQKVAQKKALKTHEKRLEKLQKLRSSLKGEKEPRKAKVASEDYKIVTAEESFLDVSDKKI